MCIMDLRQKFSEVSKFTKGGEFSVKKTVLWLLVAMCVIGSVEPVLADKAEDCKRQCESVRYEDVARNPDKYNGHNITFTGKVFQIEEEGTLIGLLIHQDNSEKFFSVDTWGGFYMRKQGEGRILNGDHIKVYGLCKGLETYENIFGGKNTVPFIQIRHYERLD